MQFLSTYLIFLSFFWISTVFAQSKTASKDTTIYITRQGNESDMSILLGNSSLNNLPFGAIIFIQEAMKDSTSLSPKISSKEKKTKPAPSEETASSTASKSSGGYMRPTEHRKVRRRKAPKWNAHKKRKKISTRKCPKY